MKGKQPTLFFFCSGKLGLFSISTSAVVSLIGSSLFVTTLDSIGDYSTCARVCRVPQPPRSAYNRGIAMAGLGNFLAGVFGCCHTTFSSGSCIATISITKVKKKKKKKDHLHHYHIYSFSSVPIVGLICTNNICAY